MYAILLAHGSVYRPAIDLSAILVAVIPFYQRMYCARPVTCHKDFIFRLPSSQVHLEAKAFGVLLETAASSPHYLPLISNACHLQ